MVLTDEERERALTIYKSRQAVNRRHLEKQRGDKERCNRTGRPPIEKPTDEQLEQLLTKYKETCVKRCKQRNPQTRDEILAVINKLTMKLEQLEKKAMAEQDAQ